MTNNSLPTPFGTLLGYAPGNVAVYSSDYDSVDNSALPDRQSFMHYVDGVYTGFKWQCVEFARRWLLLNYGYVFDDIAMAYDIFRLTQVKRVSDGQILPLKAFANGSSRHPQVGCMLIWSEGGEFEVTGHVAIITDVYPDRVCIAEQNVGHQVWKDNRHFARELPANIGEDGSYWIRCSFLNASILGWMMQTDDTSNAFEVREMDKRLLNLSMNEVKPSVGEQKIWLNMANPDEAAYVKKMRGAKLTMIDADRYRYFCMSKSATQLVKRASNELHHMFMHATDYVLRNETLFEKFNIPKILWPRLQQSWNNRRHQMITGRFDFCLTSEGIKVYEYNCDSAACYMECGKIQAKWAEHFHCTIGEDPGAQLLSKLTRAWQASGIDATLFIMIDHDEEELFHALFMQEAISAAGIRSKIIHGTDELHWEGDDVLDSEGESIRWVWKTWAWETALDQLRVELTDDVDGQSLHISKHNKPRLMDVLFKPDTLVFEPLWTLITSNKAILPVLWQMFPNHPYLLESHFELTPSLKEKGYVEKPIVGRCGANISIVDKHQETLNATDGDFHAHDSIYQALYPLPEINGFKTQVSAFTVAGVYAGAGIRTDSSLIITGDSNLMPLRIVDDALLMST